MNLEYSTSWRDAVCPAGSERLEAMKMSCSNSRNREAGINWELSLSSCFNHLCRCSLCFHHNLFMQAFVSRLPHPFKKHVYSLKIKYVTFPLKFLKTKTRRYICVEFVLTLFQMFPMMFEHSKILCFIQGNHAFHVLAFHWGTIIQKLGYIISSMNLSAWVTSDFLKQQLQPFCFIVLTERSPTAENTYFSL